MPPVVGVQLAIDCVVTRMSDRARGSSLPSHRQVDQSAPAGEAFEMATNRAPLARMQRNRDEQGAATMASRNVETYRAGHEAFNQRDFEAMTRRYADNITWTDRTRGLTFRTRQEFKEDFLAGWVGAASDIRISDPHY